ncbi:MAG: ATP-binding protein [Planctomycetaceae bacterium]|nr:ATP-binding protein [Planctomycetaceae bacterium]
MPHTHEFEEVIPSDTAAAQRVQERVIRALEEFQYSSRDIFCMRLAIEEAVTNAIKHGNRRDVSKKVFVRCLVDAERVHLVVEDEGPGFVLENVPDPTADENLDKPSGRGIKLMQSFLTAVEYNDQGNQVTLVKRREPSPEQSGKSA